MSKQTKKPSAIKDFVLGGHLTLHSTRSLFNMIHTVFGVTLLTTLVLDALWLYRHIKTYDLKLAFDYAWASFITLIDSDATQLFTFPNGTTGHVLSRKLLESHYMHQVIDQMIWQVAIVFFVSMIIHLVVCFIITCYFIMRGRSERRDRTRDVHNVQTKKLIKQIKKDGAASDITLGNVPILKDTETQHIFIHGTTGSGKSQLFYELMDHIRRRGDRAIIYDKGCEFMKHFYRQDKDILLNPLDDRGQPWQIWQECRVKADYDRVAQAMIPHDKSHADTFWVNAARTLLSSGLDVCHRRGMTQHKALLKHLVCGETKALMEFIKDTPAASLISTDADKMTLSIRSVVTNAIKSLGYVMDLSDRDHSQAAQVPFSIRRWLEDDSSDQHVFISARAAEYATLRPLLSTWLDIALYGMLSLKADSNRRIWLLMDELPSLHCLPSLQTALAEGRKYGACIVLGMQSISQLVSTYGQHNAEAIRSLTNTAAFLRSPSHKTAAWVSQQLGDMEIERVNEGLSYGTEGHRDGVSLHRNTQNMPIITANQVMSLPNLAGYLKLSNGYPVTKIEFDYHPRIQIAAPYITATQQLDQLSPWQAIADDADIKANGHDKNFDVDDFLNTQT